MNSNQNIIRLDDVISSIGNHDHNDEPSEKQVPIGKRYEYIDTDEKMKILYHETGKIAQDDLFTQDIEEFQCSICSQVFTDPVTDDCEPSPHTFCQKCLARALSTRKSCPLSRKVMNVATLPVDREKNKQVMGLKCRCYYYEYGCDWTGPYGDLNKHINSKCKHLQYKCQKCLKIFHKDKIAKHIQFCEKRIIKCKFCTNWRGTMRDKPYHDEQCPEWPIPCKHGCGKLVPRKSVKNHQENECDGYLVNCPLENIGCKSKIPRKNLKKHYEVAQQLHLELAYKQIKALLNDIERSNLEDNLFEKEDDSVTRVGKALGELKRKFYLLNDEVVKVKFLTQDMIEDNMSGEKVIQDMGTEDDYMTTIQTLVSYIPAIQSHMRSEASQKNDVMKKLGTIKDKDQTIFSTKKQLEEEEEKNKNLQQIFEQFEKEAQSLKRELNQKNEELDLLKAKMRSCKVCGSGIDNGSQNQPGQNDKANNKKGCCNIF